MVFTRSASDGDFVQSFEIRQSFMIFICRLMLIEIFILSLHVILSLSFKAVIPDLVIFGYSVFSLELLFIHFLNTFLVIYKTLFWFNRYYVISSRAITRVEGVFNRNIASQDIRTISTVNVNQGFWGFIFRFGNVIIENPFSKNEIKLLFVHNPEKWATEIRHLKEMALRDRPFNENEMALLAKYR